MGQQLIGQYPIHFHLVGDVDEKGGYDPPTYVKDLSIHHTFSRCVTVHGSNGLLVSTSFPWQQGVQSPFISFISLPDANLLTAGPSDRQQWWGVLDLVTWSWAIGGGTILGSDLRTISIEKR